jgi:hypothetical protein
MIRENQDATCHKVKGTANEQVPILDCQFPE